MAARRRRLREKAGEIALYRLSKTVGTVTGILDGRVLADPEAREAIFFDKTYKAVVVHGPGQATLEDKEIEKIAPGEVLVRVAYQSVCEADLEVFKGGQRSSRGDGATYPITPGRELSGSVVKTGVNVRHLQEGDPVVTESPQCALHEVGART